MQSRHRFFWGLLLGTSSCAQIVGADAPYTLMESSSSSGAAGGAGSTSGTGGMGGMGGVGGNGGPKCTSDADCPATGAVCVVATCTSGSCETRNVMNGTPCIAGVPSVCDGNGACVECTLAEHCVDIVEDQCTERACVDNTCQKKLLGQDIPASPTLQTPGDCKRVVCDGLGGVKTIIDDTDTPDDGNGCTIDTCTNGSKVFMTVAAGTNCGVDSFCNSSGQCVGCVMPSHCGGSYNFCRAATCESGICGIEYTAMNTPLPEGDQIAGNCQIEYCDGTGNIVSVADVTDVPDDGNPCTQDSCTIEGTPSHLPEPIDTTCSVGDNDTCDGLGTCKKSNGTSCSMGSECVSTFCIDGVCCENACNGTCSACNTSPVTAGTCTLVPFGQEDGNASMACMDTSTCDGNGSCKKVNGQTCSAAGDCSSDFCTDGVCCEIACLEQCKSCNVTGFVGKCANVPKGSMDDAATIVCNNTQACDGNGTCKLANGQTCTMDSQCASGNCKNGQNKCQP